eukprot:CAMPEP_0204843206 /NCGR_PEP_ID=MMETSP1346-20131115/47840_1 /ASSEMBLY_ACC=CAM_ASM_000771 /TAXON_ID=215587 /ORGANISM="Aplanochytrium stocchinoi, Strain GSBS06" /LENGTH=729 /DNA_ID=CAMNT_0051982313 /DNA_START=438 /DNA_END=2627 /DNA_ORIENTATION=+
MFVQADSTFPHASSLKSDAHVQSIINRDLATESELSGCLSKNSQLMIDLFIVPQCSFSRTAAKGVLEAVAEFQEWRNNQSSSNPDLNANSLAEIFVSMNPLQCVEYVKGFLYSSSSNSDNQLLCDSSVFDGYRSTSDLLSLSRDILCFQYLNEYPEINLDFADFMSCRFPIKNAAEAKKCWNLFGNDPNSEYLNRCHNNHDANFANVVGNALAFAGSLEIKSNPTLFINGKRYCGSFSKEDLVAALCAASSQNPNPATNINNWQPGMTVNANLNKDAGCDTPWWDTSTVGNSHLPDMGTCIVQPHSSFAEYLPVLLTSFFLIVSMSFFCMVIARHRVDALIVQQRRRETSSSHIQELLQILALERNIQRQFRSGDSSYTSVSRTREEVEDILKAKLQLHVYCNSNKDTAKGEVITENQKKKASPQDIEAGILSSSKDRHKDKDDSQQQCDADATLIQEQQCDPCPEVSELCIRDNPSGNILFLELDEAVDQTCPICLEVFENGDEYYEIKCGHLLHKDCLIQWTIKKNECPMCRGMIASELEPPAPSATDASTNTASGLGNVEIELQNLGLTCPEVSELCIRDNPSGNISNNLELDEAVDQTCPICLEVFENGDEYYEIKCGHLLHKDCLIQWTIKKNECPMCRGMIASELEPPAPSATDASTNTASGLGNVEIELQNLGLRQNQSANARVAMGLGLNSSNFQTIVLSTGNGTGSVRTITLAPRDVNTS